MIILSKFYCILMLLLHLPNCCLTAKTQHISGNNTNTDVGKKVQIIILKYIGNCDENQNYTFSLANFKVTQIRKNVYVLNGIMDIRGDLTGRKMRATIDTRKCDVGFHMENCQSIMYWIVDDLCKFFNSENSFYGIFFKNYPERPRCPLKRKSYQLTNIPINLEIISMLPNFGIQNYITYIKSYAGKSIIGCTAVHSSIRITRA